MSGCALSESRETLSFQSRAPESIDDLGHYHPGCRDRILGMEVLVIPHVPQEIDELFDGRSAVFEITLLDQGYFQSP